MITHFQVLFIWTSMLFVRDDDLQIIADDENEVLPVLLDLAGLSTSVNQISGQQVVANATGGVRGYLLPVMSIYTVSDDAAAEIVLLYLDATPAVWAGE